MKLIRFLMDINRIGCRFAECLAVGDDGGVGTMREETKGRQELAGKGQTDAGVATEQEATAARPAVSTREDGGRHHHPKDQDQHVDGETASAFPLRSIRLPRPRGK